jgi:hypothetical protein
MQLPGSASTRLTNAGDASLDQVLEETAFNRDTRFVAKFLGVNVETVIGWRKRRIGPPFRKLQGKLVRYRLVDLVEWAESQPAGGKRA